MLPRLISTSIELLVFHLFGGSGGGKDGFNEARAEVGNFKATWRCIGGIDNDPMCVADFNAIRGARATLMDLFSLQQFIDFHGHEPPSGWREAGPDDLRRAAGGEFPNALFFSAPCKGLSGLLNQKASETLRYQALNSLTERATMLALEAWSDDPADFYLVENVPRIMTRGRVMLDRIIALLRHHGYAWAETKHNCGELGGLAQNRDRFLMLARHRAKVPPFVYMPPKRRVRGVGEVLGRMMMPGDPTAGPMHRMPRLQWKTWVRLAFVEAGSDWRSLNKLNVVDGKLADYGIVPGADYHAGVLGVHRWEDPTGTITGRSTATNGAFNVADPRAIGGHEGRGKYGVTGFDGPAGTVIGASTTGNGAFAVADPRIDGHARSVQNGVRRWDEPAPVVTSSMFVGTGPNSVADPRVGEIGARFNNVFRIVRWDQPSQAVTACGHPTAGGQAVANPRPVPLFNGAFGVVGGDQPAGAVMGESLPSNGPFAVADPRPGYGVAAQQNKLAMTRWEDPARTVTGANQPQRGALSVADPRWRPDGREAYQTGGHYGVVPFDAPTGAVTAAGQHDNGAWSVADPREAGGEASVLPEPGQQLVAVIRALDNTWHRPFTTLELAALQGFYDPEDEPLVMAGTSDSGWRERIGNMVPPPAAQAIASTLAQTILLARLGQTFMLSNTPIWVQPIAMALAVDVGDVQ